MFETLGADLWVGAVNACPNPLALLEGAPRRIKSRTDRDDDAQDGQKKARKTVTIKHLLDLTNGTFDLSNKMGSALVASERVKFISLGGIRTAYSLAFAEDSKDIDDALSAVPLDELSMIRNVLVHAAGKVDAKYLQDMADLRQTLGPQYVLNAPELDLGQNIVFGSKLVSSLITPVVDCSIDLIKGVDAWLKKKMNMH